MKPKEFKAWRKDCGLTQEAAAKKLGLKKRTIQYYEKGERDGQPFQIPKTTELACYAIRHGVERYFGPESLNADDSD
jgi:DNA-binding XRE family transcriptional regulator